MQDTNNVQMLNKLQKTINKSICGLEFKENDFINLWYTNGDDIGGG
jgi:hypothetical protein